MGFVNFVNKKYIYQLPEGQTKTTLLSQTEVDFYLQRTTFGLKIFVDTGSGAEEYPLSIIGVQVEIFSDSTTDKLRITGNHISQVSDVWICDDSLDQKGILNISANKKYIITSHIIHWILPIKVQDLHLLFKCKINLIILSVYIELNRVSLIKLH